MTVNLLAIDASSLPASCAFFRGEMLVAEEYLHNRMTHSQTLMPMVEHMMQNAGAALQEVDAVAVTIGPGSFTGLRIGIAAAKGIAWGCGKPCVPVSTLRALACNGLCHRGVVCAVMDARCAQVYTALFESDGTGRPDCGTGGNESAGSNRDPGPDGGAGPDESSGSNEGSGCDRSSGGKTGGYLKGCGCGLRF